MILIPIPRGLERLHYESRARTWGSERSCGMVEASVSELDNVQGIYGASYAELRTWYLARLRRLGVEKQRQSLTPAALVKADSAVIQQLVKQRRESEVFESPESRLDAVRIWLVAGPFAAAVVLAGISYYNYGLLASLAVLAPAFLFVIANSLKEVAVKQRLLELRERMSKRLSGATSGTTTIKSETLEQGIAELFRALDESKHREALIAD